MAGVKRRVTTYSDNDPPHKELDEITCPICMDHPHNAVLLLCSSHDKGCKSYICDTSYRHSNCLDRYKKIKPDTRNHTPVSHASPLNTDSSSNITDVNFSVSTDLVELGGNDGNTITSVVLQGPERRNMREVSESGSFGVRRTEREENDGENPEDDSKVTLKCPMCRGCVVGWKVVEEARTYLNLKSRSCSHDLCLFSGNYQELRQHARRIHPTTRPTDVDPSRERVWRRLEHQREYGDIVSTIRSAMPGAVVIGDYAIENGNMLSSSSSTGEGDSQWLTTFFLFEMIDSIDHVSERRPRERAWMRQRRLGQRSALWGENLLGMQSDDDDEDYDDDEDSHILHVTGEDMPPVPRRRRRLTRSRSVGGHS